MADKDTYKLLDEYNENLGFDGLDLMVKEGLIESYEIVNDYVKLVPTKQKQRIFITGMKMDDLVIESDNQLEELDEFDLQFQFRKK